MAVYVDFITHYKGVNVGGHGDDWCHMWADTEAELDAMADRIRLSRRYCQDRHSETLRHYDLVPSMRRLAVAAGAVEMRYLDYLRAKRQEGDT